jgi:hypothetical protein
VPKAESVIEGQKETLSTMKMGLFTQLLQEAVGTNSVFLYQDTIPQYKKTFPGFGDLKNTFLSSSSLSDVDTETTPELVSRFNF